MTLALDLSDAVRSRLADKARAAGVDLPTYARRVLEGEAFTPPVDEILKPVRDAFKASGRTEEQLTEELEQAKRDMRAERRARSGHG